MIDILSTAAKGLLGSFFNLKLIFAGFLVLYSFKQSYYQRERIGAAGLNFSRPFKKIIEETIFIGLICGFLLSIASYVIGVTISQEAVYYYLFVIVGLSIFGMRYASFLNTTSIFVVISLVFNVQGVNITYILMLMFFLQIIEALLVLRDQGKDSFPVYIKHKEMIAGAFITEKYWPIPFAFITFWTSEALPAFFYPLTITWNALFDPRIILAAGVLLSLESLMGLTGYTDIAVTNDPKSRSRLISRKLGLYALMLALFTAFSFASTAAGVVGLILITIVKQYFNIHEMNKQKNAVPIYVSSDKGVMVLDVVANGNGEKLGLKRGDAIININGKDIQTTEGLSQVMNQCPKYIQMVVNRQQHGQISFDICYFPKGIEYLDIITIPRENDITYNLDNYANIPLVKNLVARFRYTGKSVDR